MICRLLKTEQQKNMTIQVRLESYLKVLNKKLILPLKIEKKTNYPAITANNNNATILVILIIGLTAGPAVSL